MTPPSRNASTVSRNILWVCSWVKSPTNMNRKKILTRIGRYPFSAVIQFFPSIRSFFPVCNIFSSSTFHFFANDVVTSFCFRVLSSCVVFISQLFVYTRTRFDFGADLHTGRWWTGVILKEREREILTRAPPIPPSLNHFPPPPSWLWPRSSPQAVILQLPFVQFLHFFPVLGRVDLRTVATPARQGGAAVPALYLCGHVPGPLGEGITGPLHWTHICRAVTSILSQRLLHRMKFKAIDQSLFPLLHHIWFCWSTNYKIMCNGRNPQEAELVIMDPVHREI